MSQSTCDMWLVSGVVIDVLTVVESLAESAVSVLGTIENPLVRGASIGTPCRNRDNVSLVNYDIMEVTFGMMRVSPRGEMKKKPCAYDVGVYGQVAAYIVDTNNFGRHAMYRPLSLQTSVPRPVPELNQMSQLD